MRIQLDMFAVELGAAILLQFQTPDGIVRVLADGGEARHHVDQKLQGALTSFMPDGDGSQAHIDLMIGTHYDADHLAGLVDIVKSNKVSIGEAWLPPVANDTEPNVGLSFPGDAQLLALQFAGEDGDRVLRQYLDSKARTCGRLAAAERKGDEFRRLFRGGDEQMAEKFVLSAAGPAGGPTPDTAFFEWHIADAARTLGRDASHHADAVYDDDLGDEEGASIPYSRRWWRDSPEAMADSWSELCFGVQV